MDGRLSANPTTKSMITQTTDARIVFHDICTMFGLFCSVVVIAVLIGSHNAFISIHQGCITEKKTSAKSYQDTTKHEPCAYTLECTLIDFRLLINYHKYHCYTQEYIYENTRMPWKSTWVCLYKRMGISLPPPHWRRGKWPLECITIKTNASLLVYETRGGKNLC